MLQGRQVSNHEYLRVTRKAEVGLDQYTARAIRRATQLASQRGSGDAGCPKHHAGMHHLAANMDLIWADTGYSGIQAYFHAKAFQLEFGALPQVLGIGA